MTDAPASDVPGAAGDADATEEATLPSDPAREAVLGALAASLGDGLVEPHLVHGRDLVVRVARERWQDAGRALRDQGFAYFGFLSAIDWMIAPEGRYEDTEFEDEPIPDATDAEVTGEGDSTPDEGTPTDGAASAGGPDTGEATSDEVAPGAEPASMPAATGGGPAFATHRVAGGSTRFQMIARVQKPGTALGVTLKADLPEDDLRIDTWIDIYAGANWHEREAWEMFGIDFVGHPGLRHIYLPTEFEGHPLRKDYPLLARVVKPWPGVVDIEEIPAHLEERLEAEVMAAFEAEQGGSAGAGAGGGEDS